MLAYSQNTVDFSHCMKIKEITSTFRGFLFLFTKAIEFEGNLLRRESFRKIEIAGGKGVHVFILIGEDRGIGSSYTFN